MTGDFYKIVCCVSVNYHRHRVGLSCGCSLIVDGQDFLKDKLPCMGIHASDTPATPPPGGWPHVEPPKGDDADDWKKS